MLKTKSTEVPGSIVTNAQKKEISNVYQSRKVKFE